MLYVCRCSFIAFSFMFYVARLSILFSVFVSLGEFFSVFYGVLLFGVMILIIFCVFLCGYVEGLFKVSGVDVFFL